MTRGQTSCSLGGTDSLGLLFPYFILTIFIAVFPKTNFSFDGFLTLLRESCRHSKSFGKPLLFFLFLAIKSTLITVSCNEMCHVCYYNNSDATFCLLMSGDINPNPGPVSSIAS